MATLTFPTLSSTMPAPPREGTDEEGEPFSRNLGTTPPSGAGAMTFR